jgi:hypothetical protein
MAGAEGLATTLTRLSLYNCPALPSLSGVQVLHALEAVALDSLRQVSTLEFARRLSGLRHLDVFELKDVESLWPLADHPSLEFLAFGRIRDLDLEPLTRLPRLKLILTGFYPWNRDLHDFPNMHDVHPGDPAVVEWRALQAR